MMKNKYVIDGNTLIVYNKKDNQEMFFSLQDADMVKQYTWHIDKGYVKTNIRVATGKQTRLRAHRLLMNPSAKMQVDHINGVRHDNRRSNLRIVTNQVNQHNRRSVKGYFWDKRNRRYTAQIALNKKQIYLGLYNTEDEAHAAYVAAKQKYHPSAPIHLYTDILKNKALP